MSLFVPDGFLYESIEDLRAHHPSVDVIEVMSKEVPTNQRTWDREDKKILIEVIDQINALGGRNFRFKPTNEGCRLMHAALKELRSEGANDESVYDQLMMVVDWGAQYWLQSLKMRKYFTPSSLFRKGKWRERMEQMDKQAVVSTEGW